MYIGKPGPNFKKYYEECLKASNDRTYFLGQIEHEKLPQFYKLAKVHILASWMETPGLSSLEAGVMKTNIVVTKKGDTEDYFQDLAYYCEPDNLKSIRTAVVQAFEAPYNPDLYNRIISNYTWEDTARQTLTGYESIFSATE